MTMERPPSNHRSRLHLMGLLCAACFALVGCGDYHTNAGVSLPAAAPPPPVDEAPAAVEGDSNAEADATATTAESSAAATGASQETDEPSPDAAGSPDTAASKTATTTTAPTSVPPPKDRSFAVEGPDGALRVGFDDLDLLKLLRMDPVTTDCVEKMPGWLRGLAGKRVRIRGYMKPSLVSTNLPQFLFVRDTGLCCFGPKGKIYDLIAVTLKEGTTTDYIELRPFDVVGTFRIEVLELDEGTIFGLYYIDDAVIIR